MLEYDPTKSLSYYSLHLLIHDRLNSENSTGSSSLTASLSMENFAHECSPCQFRLCSNCTRIHFCSTAMHMLLSLEEGHDLILNLMLKADANVHRVNEVSGTKSIDHHNYCLLIMQLALYSSKAVTLSTYSSFVKT
jgi:hypothetical protein